MNEKIKITEEELNTVRTIQGGFHQTQMDFGRLYLEKMAVDKAIKDITEKEGGLQERWTSLQKQENDTIDAILKKYGEGSLDLTDGMFIPEISTPSIPPK
jgi:hypothetical protein